MKKIDKITLVDKIGRKLQSEMSYADIKNYLTEFGVDCNKPTSGVNSKWIYVKELLAGEKNSLILELADELGIDHALVEAELNLADINFWRPGYFKLFLSHKHEKRANVKRLQSFLYGYGVSCFVAHEDIKPTKIWVSEIEKALQTMDALGAILTIDFHDSDWTDQEVGAAVSRNVLIIPVISGTSPYGFMEKYQGLKAAGKTISEVGEAVYQILLNDNRTRLKLITIISEQLLASKDTKIGEHFLGLLIKEEGKTFFIEMLIKVQSNIVNNEILINDPDFLKRLNDLFKRNGINEIKLSTSEEVTLDDLPF